MEDWLSIGELYERTGIPERTLRRYLARYRDYLTLKTHNRSYLVHETGVPTLQAIRDQYAQGRSHQEVLGAIQGAMPPREEWQSSTLPSPEEGLDPGLPHPELDQDSLRYAIDVLRDELETTRSQLVSEAKARSAAEEARDRYILRRDEELIATMRHLLSERKKPWWQRRGTSVV